MSQWLLRIVGIAFLGVLVDILYPSGKTNKFCKGIFSLLSLFIIISPVFNIKVDNFGSIETSNVITKEYKDIHDNLIKSQIGIVFNDMDISPVNVEIDSIIDNGEYDIKNIYIDISQAVLLDGDLNINNYEEVTNRISEMIGVEGNKIFIYG